jgi:hypothetical protein
LYSPFERARQGLAIDRPCSSVHDDIIGMLSTQGALIILRHELILIQHLGEKTAQTKGEKKKEDG